MTRASNEVSDQFLFSRHFPVVAQQIHHSPDSQIQFWSNEIIVTIT